MTDPGFKRHNVIATFPEEESARRALEALKAEGIDAKDMSYLSRRNEEAVSQMESRQEAVEVSEGVAKDVAAGGAAGTAAGGAAGFIAGAIAFGIPGIGPAVGAGIWAATLGGAAAGATAGGVIGGIKEMWEARYRDAVREGSVLVGVHADDPQEVERAARVLEKEEPARLDSFGPAAEPAPEDPEKPDR
jgi:hypothetical protein